ncbi:MAG: R3H domain-containing nucleic acid-binding protein [bacterium]|nr:R3H domain-containing nucleic acid-binding protein [bacterium]
MEQEIKTFLTELFSKMNISTESVELIPSYLPSYSTFLVKSQDSRLLIGSRGETLSALTYLVRKIVAKKVGHDDSKIIIDINNYQEKNIQSLKDKAMILGERVKNYRISVEMEPMSPYERMIIHTVFENNPNVKTESQGEGAGRRVVLKFVETEETF